MSTKKVISKDERINRKLYKGLYNNNKTNLKVTLGFCYFGVCAEVFKILYQRKLLTTLISTIGSSFFIGSIYYYHKITPEKLIKFVPRQSQDSEYIQDNEDEDENEEDDEEEEEEEEEEYDEEIEKQLMSTAKKPTFNYLNYYKFIPYGMLGGVIGNAVATAGLAIQYDSDVAVEWNREFYAEIISYICGTTIHNTVVFGAVDSFMKTKWFMFNKKKILNK